MKILAVIPARGGSKGVPRKNIRPLAGKPLLAYTAEASLASSLLDRIVLSSEDKEIIETAKQFGIEVPFKRPIELAKDDTPALPVIQHAVTTLKQIDAYVPDAIVILQPTSPLRTAHHIDEALDIFVQNDADSLVSVIKVPHNCNPYSVMSYEGGLLKPFLDFDERNNLRDKKPVFYARNGAAIYAMTHQCLMQKNSIYGEKILPYFMSKEDSLDIDDEWDWQVCEHLLKMRCVKE